MFVEDLTSLFFAGENTNFLKLLEVFRSGLTLSNSGFDQELNLTVGLGEDQLDEFLGIDFGRKLGTTTGERLIKEVADRDNSAGCPICRFFDSSQAKRGANPPRRHFPSPRAEDCSIPLCAE